MTKMNIDIFCYTLPLLTVFTFFMSFNLAKPLVHGLELCLGSASSRDFFVLARAEDVEVDWIRDMMALDAQSNWNVEMAKPSRIVPVIVPNIAPKITSSSLEASKSFYWQEVLLPVEIIIQILSYIPRRASEQKTLWACCLVSRTWYFAAVPLLYERPYLGGGNFQNFVTTVCPSKNAHIRKSQLAGFVQTLDMGELVHDGSKSLTARLLGRLKGNLVEFTAPQASFSINSFAALSKCTKLSFLNLSLMSASVPPKLLFQALQSLKNLEVLFFPRTSINNDQLDLNGYMWPSALKTLHFAGGISDLFLRLNVYNFPQTLERLSIQLCPQVYTSALQETLEAIGPRLKHLTIRYPMHQLQWSVLDETLTWCPNLIAIRISADYISDMFFDPKNVPLGHPLQILDLDCSESADAVVGINPDSIWIAIDNGCLPNLRSVRVSVRLAWQATHTLRSSVSDLIDLLEEQEKACSLGVEPGVWTTA